ncbi:MAG: hypothetical protein ACE5JA_09685 [bacterium]
MGEHKRMYLLLATSTVLLCCGCSYYHESYSILESAPYLNYGGNVTPEPVDGSTGFAVGFGGGYEGTNTDSDTSISAFEAAVSLAANLGSIVEIVYTPSLSISEEMFPYGILDAKFTLLDEPVTVSPDFGLGMGLGKAGFMVDGRMLMVFGLPLLGGRINPYVAPKLMMLFYPYELSGYIPTTKRTFCPVYGLDAGLSFSIQITGDDKSAQKLMIRPGVTYMTGEEPKGDKIRFSIVEIGISVLFAP